MENTARARFREAKDLIEKQYFESIKRARDTKIIQESLPAVGKPPPPHRLAREPLIRAAINDACYEFARTKQLPFMDEEAAVFMWDRFEQAFELCGWVLRNDIQFPHKGVEELLILFLVEFWLYSGHLRWSSGERAALF